MWRLRQVLLLLLSFSFAQTDPLRRQNRCPNGASPHSRPYMAALLDSQNRYICGGFLVGHQWVMTSARCGSVDMVVLGAHDLKHDGETYRVDERYPDKDYTIKNNTFSNDILLLKVPHPKPFSHSASTPEGPDPEGRRS
ncbi:granzyme B(G,H)-like [Podarcis raffonei]|uniref:granzyme B(G,H)-like n=1 Tax=Podarcis raffonei TaxID=65483 RepID=UPI00232937FD|nr:granzyme B(G,H)-like [Podarcis raffonei]